MSTGIVVDVGASRTRMAVQRDGRLVGPVCRFATRAPDDPAFRAAAGPEFVCSIIVPRAVCGRGH